MVKQDKFLITNRMGKDGKEDNNFIMFQLVIGYLIDKKENYYLRFCLN